MSSYILWDQQALQTTLMVGLCMSWANRKNSGNHATKKECVYGDVQVTLSTPTHGASKGKSMRNTRQRQLTARIFA